MHLPSALEVSGYEIHHGVSSGSLPAALRFEDGCCCGAIGADGRIWGSYLHGIFDEDLFRRWFIDDLRKGRGLEATGIVLAPYNLEAAFDRLAARVRQSLDMERIYALLRL